MMNYFSALHKYDLEIRFHRRDLYQTSAFCGHVFTMKLLLKKINTWTHDRKQMWLPDAHLCYFILSAARPCVAVLLRGAATSSAISPQMHHQNPADAPPESRGTTRIRRTPTESCLHLQRVIERKQSHKLWIIDTAYIRGFTCVLNFAISWIQCPHNEINNKNCVNFK